MSQPGSKVSEILEGWDEVAKAARLSPLAPKPSHAPVGLGVLGMAAAVIAVVVALGMRGPGLIGGADPGSASPGSDSATGAVPTTSETASAQETSSAACSAAQLQLGKASMSYGAAALGTTLVFVTLPVRNQGDTCVLQIPETISVASAAGPMETVSAENAGAASEVTIEAGASASIVLGAWWPIPGIDQTPARAAPCDRPVTDVSRVRIPTSAGAVDITLDQPWARVCSSPASVSLTVSG